MRSNSNLKKNVNKRTRRKTFLNHLHSTSEPIEGVLIIDLLFILCRIEEPAEDQGLGDSESREIIEINPAWHFEGASKQSRSRE